MHDRRLRHVQPGGGLSQGAAGRARTQRAPGRIVQLRLYALFMQATSGNASGSRPGFSDFEARSRWDAWQALSGLAREDAMSEYIAEAGRLKYRQLLGAV